MTLDPLVIHLAVFIGGLILGSFLNVVGLRLLSETSIVTPGSHCPHCKTPLGWLENIPVLSFLLQAGRCRTCKQGISIQYPLVEIATGLLFVLSVWKFGWGWQTPLLWFLVANLVVIVITDWHESLIFHINSMPLVVTGLLFAFWLPADQPGWVWGPLTLPAPVVSALLGSLAAIVLFEGLILFSKIFLGTEGFGHGDTHLMMGVGAYLGWQLCLIAIVMGFFIQSVAAIPMLIAQWLREKNYRSLISAATAALFGMMPLLLTPLGLGPTLQLLVTLGCMAITAVALFVFLKGIRQREQYTYMPLGPALVIGSLVCLFCGDSIRGWFSSLYG